MRIPVDIIFVAVAVCLVDVSTHAERSGIITKLPCSLSAGGSEVPTERQLRGQETVQDDEERVGPAAVEAFSPEHIDEWLSAEKSTADVFKLLALDKAENVLSHSNLALLDNFVKRFNRANPKGARTSVIAILTTHYGEEGLFKIIEAAKQVPETASLATRWQEKQLNFWVGKTKEPNDVFAIMELDKAGDELFEKPLMIMCVKYVNMFNEEYPDKKKTVLSLFLEKYDQKKLVHMLIAAKEVPSTKKIAVRVQAELTMYWHSVRMPPVRIFRLLDLDKTRYALFKSPLFAAWLKYVHDYNPKNGQIVEALPILMSLYSLGALAKMPIDMSKSPGLKRLAIDLKLQVQKRWFEQHQLSPEQAHKYVKSVKPPKGSTLLRASEDYEQYFKIHQLEYYNKVSALKEKYKEPEVLAKMVLKASTNPETGVTSWGMLGALLKHWIGERAEPNTVRKWLRVEDTMADSDTKKLNDIINKLNDDYSKMYDDEHRNR